MADARPGSSPLVRPILGRIVAMFPDFLFEAGIAHRRWMDVFLGHLATHFVPGLKWTWYVIFLVCLAVYLSVIGRGTTGSASALRLDVVT